MKARDDAGTVSITVLVLLGVLVAVGGLITDGGARIAAVSETKRVAEQAARAGANELDTDSLRTGGSDVDASAATRRAQSYVSRRGLAGSVNVDGGAVTVRVSKPVRSIILRIFDRDGGVVYGQATARTISQQGE